MRVNSFHPTTNQKRVLAKIIASETSTVAAGTISSDVNVVAARNQLMKLGMITFTGQEAELTAYGAQVAVDENISDENGQLTDAGQALASTGSSNKPQEQPGSSGMTAPMESLSLLRQLLNWNDYASR